MNTVIESTYRITKLKRRSKAAPFKTFDLGDVFTLQLPITDRCSYTGPKSAEFVVLDSNRNGTGTIKNGALVRVMDAMTIERISS